MIRPFKKNLNKSTVPRQHKIKRLGGQSHSQLTIKGTFRHGKICKIWYNYDRNMMRPPFFIIFPGFSDIKNQP